MLKLNSLSRELFASSGVGDSKVVVNGKEIRRNDIIASGRTVAVEYFGRALESRSKKNGIVEKYNSRLVDVDYATYDEAHKNKKFLFCAAQAYAAVGKEAPTLEQAKNDYSLAKDTVFLKTMAAIDRDVLTPLIFSVFDDISANGLMQWVPAEMGRTTEIEIKSNDVFLFEDSSWGSGRSTSKNYMYAKTITMTPEMFSCNATIKWYQDIVNGEAGRYYAAILNGMWNKIYAIFVSSLNAAKANTVYIPAALKATTYTTGNMLSVSTKVAAANGVRRQDLMVFGEIGALSVMLPVDGAGGAITGLQYGLGEQWFTNGFLPNIGGMDAFEVTPVVVPGTQNTTINTIGLGNDLWIIPKAGMGYAPMYGVYAKGFPITLTATPSETADFTIDINVGALFAIKPVFASKLGLVTAVSA